jgi:hypothetical protein
MPGGSFRKLLSMGLSTLLLQPNATAKNHQRTASKETQRHRSGAVACTYPWRPLGVVSQHLPQQAGLHHICQAAQQLVCILLPPARKAPVHAQQGVVQVLRPLCTAAVAVDLARQLRLNKAADASTALLPLPAYCTVDLRACACDVNTDKGTSAAAEGLCISRGVWAVACAMQVASGLWLHCAAQHSC